MGARRSVRRLLPPVVSCESGNQRDPTHDRRRDRYENLSVGPRERNDLVVRFDYRWFSSNDDGYARKHEYTRHSLSLDVIRFFGDYHGFVPYVGAGVSADQLTFEVEDDVLGHESSTRAWKPAWSIQAGWDIRPTKTSAWVIRTNFRYSPFLQLRAGNDRVRFDYLELNLLQLVFYPERLFTD